MTVFEFNSSSKLVWITHRMIEIARRFDIDSAVSSEFRLAIWSTTDPDQRSDRLKNLKTHFEMKIAFGHWIKRCVIVSGVLHLKHICWYVWFLSAVLYKVLINLHVHALHFIGTRLERLIIKNALEDTGSENRPSFFRIRGMQSGSLSDSPGLGQISVWSIWMLILIGWTPQRPVALLSNIFVFDRFISWKVGLKRSERWCSPEPRGWAAK